MLSVGTIFRRVNLILYHICLFGLLRMVEPPETKRQPVVETIHGTEVIDPYRWLESEHDAVREWERRQNAFTDQVVQTGTSQSLAEAFERLNDHIGFGLPTYAGGTYYQRVHYPDDELPRLMRKDSRNGQLEEILGSDQFAEDNSIEWCVPNGRGDLILLGVAAGGREMHDLHVINGEDGSIESTIPDVGWCHAGAVGWDTAGFYYTKTGTLDDGTQLEKEIRYHEIDGADRLITADIPERRKPRIKTAPQHDLAVVGLRASGRGWQIYVIENGDFNPVFTKGEEIFEPIIVNDKVLFRTNFEAPRFQVLATNIEELSSVTSPTDLDVNVPESDDVLIDIAPAGAGFALHRLRNAESRVTLHYPAGDLRHELSLPEFSGVNRRNFTGTVEGAEAIFKFEGLDRPSSIVHTDADNTATAGDWEITQSPELPSDLDPRQELDVTVSKIWGTSEDGTSVPAHIVHRSDLNFEDGAPTIVYGYGGFRNPRVLRLSTHRLPFIRDGGVFVISHIRGGLEFGEEWHQQGQGPMKTNTFADIEAIGTSLIENGIADPKRIGAWGGSNGGLTVGASLVRRPDLWSAIICNVPVLDMVRFHKMRRGGFWTGEWGDPDKPEEFEWLFDYSPYHNIDSASYPPTLIVTGRGDSRVDPAHARKMVARLQEANGDSGPICYRSYERAGHGPGVTRSLKIRKNVDRWSFIYNVFDMNPAGE